MRYVIGVCVLTVLIIWDGWHNDGRYLAMGVRTVADLLRMVGVH